MTEEIIIYVIDACALIYASKIYNLSKITFKSVWDKISELFDNNELISSIEIFDEIKDEDLKNYLQKHKNNFIPLNQDIQNKTKEILKTYSTMIKITAKSVSNADVFLIATALKYKDLGNNVIVVTDEKSGDEGSGQYKIPNVCKGYNIPCIKLEDFINRIVK